ncbi:MAG TPA: hypothetical protein VMK65_00895 [Longimicrobiales bacterium]|nr:hypothetical protein [Longimicrobiales bacterium]
MVALACGIVPQLLLFSSAAAQDTVLYYEDWRSAAEGQLPASMSLVGGGAAIVARDGGMFLRVGAPQQRFRWTGIDLLIGSPLPAEFTIEFDMLVPQSTAYPVEVSVPLATEQAGYRGANNRTAFVTATCGAIRTGVYGGYSTTKTVRQADDIAPTLRRCRAAIRGRRLEVSFADSGPISLDDVDFGSGDRIRIVIPATDGQEAYIGAIRVSGTGPLAARTTPQSPTPPPSLSTPGETTLSAAVIEVIGNTSAPTALTTVMIELEGNLSEATGITTGAIELVGNTTPPTILTAAVLALVGNLSPPLSITTDTIHVAGTP